MGFAPCPETGITLTVEHLRYKVMCLMLNSVILGLNRRKLDCCSCSLEQGTVMA